MLYKNISVNAIIVDGIFFPMIVTVDHAPILNSYESEE